MALMEWSDKFSVGVGEIDAQHKKLIVMVNDLHAAMGAGKGTEIIGTILDDLIAYTGTHFAYEEQLFSKTNYPDEVAHKAEHAALVRDVVDIQSKYKSGAVMMLSMQVMDFLKNWLINHIQGTDKKYGPHLNSAGIK